MKLTTRDVRRIRELRYEDGLSCARVAELVGCTAGTVGRYAPGKPGKVPNDKLRAAFIESSMTAAGVAREMGWFHHHGADSSRVRRALGLTAGTPSRGDYRSKFIDAETAGLMAEALGLMGWEVMPDELEAA